MFVRFQDNLPRAQRGGEVTFGCFIDNTLTATADVTYVVESDPPVSWGVLGPPQLPAQSTTPITVRLTVPGDLPANQTTIAVAVIVRLRETGLQARAEAVLEVDRSRLPRVAFAGPPSLTLNRDGTATVSARVVNFGPVDVAVDLRVRHVDGWAFDVDAPTVTVGAGVGPVAITSVVGKPGETAVEVGDHLRVELAALGDVLDSADVSVGAAARTTRRRVRRLLSAGFVAAVAVVTLASNAGLLAWGDVQPAGVNTGATEASTQRSDPEKPGEDTPGEDTPGEDTPGEDTPGEDTPGEDTSEPESKPSEPESKPSEPESKPSEPESKPSEPEIE